MVSLPLAVRLSPYYSMVILAKHPPVGLIAQTEHAPLQLHSSDLMALSLL